MCAKRVELVPTVKISDDYEVKLPYGRIEIDSSKKNKIIILLTQLTMISEEKHPLVISKVSADENNITIKAEGTNIDGSDIILFSNKKEMHFIYDGQSWHVVK